MRIQRLKKVSHLSISNCKSWKYFLWVTHSNECASKETWSTLYACLEKTFYYNFPVNKTNYHSEEFLGFYKTYFKNKTKEALIMRIDQLRS